MILGDCCEFLYFEMMVEGNDIKGIVIEEGGEDCYIYLVVLFVFIFYIGYGGFFFLL